MNWRFFELTTMSLCISAARGSALEQGGHVPAQEQVGVAVGVDAHRWQVGHPLFQLVHQPHDVVGQRGQRIQQCRLRAAQPPLVPREPLRFGPAEVGSIEPAIGARMAADGAPLRHERGAWQVSSRDDEALAELAAWLHEQGLASRWRDELLPVIDAEGKVHGAIERAAMRPLGLITQAVHLVGRHPDGRFWVQQRAHDKATDPGLFDNLVGGGVPDGQSPYEAVLREGWEEAGLTRAQMQRATPGRRIRLWRAIPEGLQHEWLSSFDLMLAPDEVPRNQDGEVANFRLLPVADALALAAGDTMTVDAALVTLDFGLRHALLDAAEHAELAARAEGLWLP